MSNTHHHFETITDARAYAMAGNAIITLESAKTGNHFTYKILAPKEETEKGGLVTDHKADIRFVKLLTEGSADEGTFTYIGIVGKNGFRLTKASKVGIDSPSVKAFGYFMTISNLTGSNLVVHRPNNCGRCGRTLTTPDSILTGIGPECAQKITDGI